MSGVLPSSLRLDEDDTAIWNMLFDEDESERLILISVIKLTLMQFLIVVIDLISVHIFYLLGKVSGSGKTISEFKGIG